MYLENYFVPKSMMLETCLNPITLIFYYFEKRKIIILSNLMYNNTIKKIQEISVQNDIVLDKLMTDFKGDIK